MTPLGSWSEHTVCDPPSLQMLLRLHSWGLLSVTETRKVTLLAVGAPAPSVSRFHHSSSTRHLGRMTLPRQGYLEGTPCLGYDMQAHKSLGHLRRLKLWPPYALL